MIVSLFFKLLPPTRFLINVEPEAVVLLVITVLTLNAPEVWLVESTFLVKPKAEIMPVFPLSIISALAILKLPSESNVAVTPLPARKFIKPDNVVFWSIVYVYVASFALTCIAPFLIVPS